jgi:cell division septal protein FtsQ
MMRRRQHTPRYLARRNTVTMRARALKRKRPKHKRSGVTRVLVTALAVTLVLMLAGYGAYRLVKHLHQSPQYIVKEIHVEGATLLGPDAVLELGGLEPGRPILDYSIRRARRDMMKNPMIRAATVVRQLPNTLIVRVVERIPIAQLSAGGKLFLVDADGFLLTESDSPDTLPHIEGVYIKIKDPQPGTQIENDKIAAGLQVLRLCQASSIPSLMPVELVDVHNLRNIQLRAKVGPKTPKGTVFFLGDGQFGQRLARLEKALQQMSEPITKPRVDLRLQRVAL